MPSVDADIDRHYGSHDIVARIDAALRGAGIDPAAPQRADLAAFDEFHGGGIASTRDLARFARLAAGDRVLDIGCGIGGPARTLAAEFDCHVTGLDVTHEFVRAATRLTARLGMQSQVEFRHGSATALPFDDASFDVVWSQNMLMNVADKAALFAEVRRVLRGGGQFAFEAVLAGDGRPPHLPAFWAAHAGLNYLVTQSELATLLAAAGLEVLALDDTTAQVIENGRRRKAAIEAADVGRLSIAVIVADDVGAKVDNALRNNEEGRTRAIRGVCRRPS